MEHEPHPRQPGGACARCLRRAVGPRPFDEGAAQLEHVPDPGRIRPRKSTSAPCCIGSVIAFVSTCECRSLSIPSPPRPGRGSGCRKVFFVRPDIVLAKHKTAIFVHGCFWHRHRGCKNCTTPTHRRAWWLKKLEGNAARDKLHQRALRKLGWRSVVIWECQTEKPRSLEKLTRRLANLLRRPPAGGYLSNALKPACSK